LLPFAARKNCHSAAALTIAGVFGVCRPVSRLAIIGDSPIAVRVLIADAAREGCGQSYSSPITRLRGRGDTTRSRR
jgi:hypothetical protein